MYRCPRSVHTLPMRWLALGLLLVGCARFPDPATLPGRYQSSSAPATLELRGGAWRLESGPLVKQGVYQISGDRVALLITEVNRAAYSTYCRTEADVYEWSPREGALTFRQVGDTCDPVGAAVLTAGPWERAP